VSRLVIDGQIVINLCRPAVQRVRVLTDIQSSNVLCVMVSFLDLRSHFRLIGVCRSLCAICRLTPSFPPVIDCDYSTQAVLDAGLSRLAAYRARPVSLAFHCAGPVASSASAEFMAWLAADGSNRLTRLDLGKIHIAPALIVSISPRLGSRLQSLPP